jgi:hypothetical protein
VLAYVPIECQRAFGPGFLLSLQDEDRLSNQLEELERRAERTGLNPVGWFASRLQGDPHPSPDHRRLHAAHFLESQKLMLIGLPDLLGDVRLHVSVRYENEDRLTTYANHLVVEAMPLRAPIRRPAGTETDPAAMSRTSRWTRARRTDRRDYVPPTQELASLTEMPAVVQQVRPSALAASAMLATALLLFVMAGALWLKNQGHAPMAWLLQRSGMERLLAVSPIGALPRPTPLPSLHASAQKGRLSITWDPAGLYHANALRGAVEVRAGNEVLRLPLSFERLRRGALSLDLPSALKSVRFEYQTAEGRHGEELLRFQAKK